MKRYNFILLLVLALLLMSGNALASPGTAKVTLLKKAEDVPSMAQKALKPEVNWTGTGDGRAVTLEFLPLEFMGARGYLGEVTVAGQSVRVTSYYNEYDSYNDPKKGTDGRMKGKLYPKTVTFVADPTISTYAIKFYVPVMGEMGFGEQEARLKITWPDGDVKREAPAEKKTPPSDAPASPMDAEDGLYTLDVALWHETEDKPSMATTPWIRKRSFSLKTAKEPCF